MSEEEKKDVAVAESGLGCDVCCPPNGCLGTQSYDYKHMCTPSFLAVCMGKKTPAPFFFGKDDKLPIMLSLFLGFQHAIAMLGGIATSGGYLIANDACLPWQRDSEMCGRKAWLISTAWLACGLLSIVQIFRLKCGGYSLGTGLISMMGTSFTFLPIARTMTIAAISDAKATTCADNNGTAVFTGECCFGGDCKGAGAIGYGKFLGTCLVAALVECIIAMLPPRIIKKLFPPVVTGACVMLIGGGLLTSGMKYLGGGVFCAENTESRSTTFGGPQLCAGDNGDVVLPFGSPEYVGLGMSVIFASILIQIFGSPFLKSTFLFWAMIFGVIMAGVSGKDVDGDGEKESYFRRDYMDAADEKPITFFWVEGTFPISFAPEYFIPILVGFLISTAESIGDITITCRFSAVIDENDVASRIQGGLLADGVNSFIAGLLGSPPNTTFSQNCGLIPLTRCASRSAGFSACFFLIILGLFSHIGAAFASIPICVVGGVVLQAWASVFVSGMALATQDFTRRNQFILAIALGVGIGVAMETHIVDWPGPYTFFRRNLAYDYGFWPEKDVCSTPNAPWINEAGKCQGVGIFGVNNGNCCSEYDTNLKMWRTTCLMILKTPYCIGFILAFILNLIIPEDIEDTEGSGFPGPTVKREITTGTATA